MVETFGHLYGNNEVFIDGATNKSALFWKERRSISTPFCLEWLEFCKDESEGECYFLFKITIIGLNNHMPHFLVITLQC